MSNKASLTQQLKNKPKKPTESQKVSLFDDDETGFTKSAPKKDVKKPLPRQRVDWDDDDQEEKQPKIQVQDFRLFFYNSVLKKQQEQQNLSQKILHSKIELWTEEVPKKMNNLVDNNEEENNDNQNVKKAGFIDIQKIIEEQKINDRNKVVNTQEFFPEITIDQTRIKEQINLQAQKQQELGLLGQTNANSNQVEQPRPIMFINKKTLNNPDALLSQLQLKPSESQKEQKITQPSGPISFTNTKKDQVSSQMQAQINEAAQRQKEVEERILQKQKQAQDDIINKADKKTETIFSRNSVINRSEPESEQAQKIGFRSNIQSESLKNEPVLKFVNKKFQNSTGQVNSLINQNITPLDKPISNLSKNQDDEDDFIQVAPKKVILQIKQKQKPQ